MRPTPFDQSLSGSLLLLLLLTLFSLSANALSNRFNLPRTEPHGGHFQQHLFGLWEGQVRRQQCQGALDTGRDLAVGLTEVLVKRTSAGPTITAVIIGALVSDFANQGAHGLC